LSSSFHIMWSISFLLHPLFSLNFELVVLHSCCLVGLDILLSNISTKCACLLLGSLPIHLIYSLTSQTNTRACVNKLTRQLVNKHDQPIFSTIGICLFFFSFVTHCVVL
jgi:hypothetical protein